MSQKIYTYDPKNGLKDINGGGHKIKNESGTTLTQRDNLQFVGAEVSDNADGNATVITVQSGSIVNVSTGDEGLFGQTVTLSDGTTTLTGQFSSQGQCTFRGVMLSGTLTLSATAEGTTVTQTVNVPYYSTYNVEMGRTPKTINITSAEPTLYGQSATITYDTSKTKTVTLSSTGTATVVLYDYTGDVTITSTDGEMTAESVITITSSVDTYNVELSFGVKKTIEVSTSETTLYGQTVTMTYDTSRTKTATLSAQGTATFVLYDYTGNITLTATDGENTAELNLTITESTDTYQAPLTFGTPYTLNISTAETTLYGETVTVTYGSATKTATLSAQGTATVVLYNYTGAVSVTATDGEETATTNVTIVSGTSTYSVALSFGQKNVINVTTEEATLIGKTVTAVYGSKTKTDTISAQGEASFVFYGESGTVTVSATDGTDDAEAKANISSGITTYEVSLSFAQIYGVSWSGGSSPAMTRTDAAAGFVDPSPAVNNGNGSSPFDDILPWSGMKIVDDSAVGKLVSIPKYYYKWAKSGTTMTLQISSKEFDGSHVSPAHADRGDGAGERDVVYVGRYHCATNTYKSTTGVKPQVSQTRSAFRTSIHNLGTTIWQYDFAMYWTIMMLYLVEYANWNSQATIGYGCGNNSGTENAGLTDAMAYHTGTNAANRSTYGHTQYRHIEDLWGNVYDWCDGIYFAAANVYIINTPANFSDTSGGTKVGTRPTSSNYISAWNVPSISGLEWALYPSAVSGSESTYICDYCYYDSSGVVLRVGGNYNQDQNRGAFCLNGHYNASYSHSYIGSRLQKLPA